LTPGAAHLHDTNASAAPFRERNNFEVYIFGQLFHGGGGALSRDGQNQFSCRGLQGGGGAWRKRSKTDAGAGGKFRLSVALHGAGRIISRDGRVALSGAGEKTAGDA